MIATKPAAGIPTTYHGIRFRSRLEATWAAFFDQLRWEWVYEPFDCAGWIPDFALKSRTGSGAVASRPVLVEVKPTFELEPAVPGKIDAADMEHEVLLVGLGPLVGRGYGLLCIGWLRELVPVGLDEVLVGAWDWAPLGRWKGSASDAKNPTGLIGFCHQSSWFGDRITGCYDGGHRGGEGPFDKAEITALWAHAKNSVQWKPR